MPVESTRSPRRRRTQIGTSRSPAARGRVREPSGSARRWPARPSAATTTVKLATRAGATRSSPDPLFGLAAEMRKANGGHQTSLAPQRTAAGYGGQTRHDPCLTRPRASAGFPVARWRRRRGRPQPAVAARRGRRLRLRLNASSRWHKLLGNGSAVVMSQFQREHERSGHAPRRRTTSTGRAHRRALAASRADRRTTTDARGAARARAARGRHSWWERQEGGPSRWLVEATSGAGRGRTSGCTARSARCPGCRRSGCYYGSSSRRSRRRRGPGGARCWRRLVDHERVRRLAPPAAARPHAAVRWRRSARVSRLSWCRRRRAARQRRGELRHRVVAAGPRSRGAGRRTGGWPRPPR